MPALAKIGLVSDGPAPIIAAPEATVVSFPGGDWIDGDGNPAAPPTPAQIAQNVTPLGDGLTFAQRNGLGDGRIGLPMVEILDTGPALVSVDQFNQTDALVAAAGDAPPGMVPDVNFTTFNPEVVRDPGDGIGTVSRELVSSDPALAPVALTIDPTNPVGDWAPTVEQELVSSPPVVTFVPDDTPTQQVSWVSMPPPPSLVIGPGGSVTAVNVPTGVTIAPYVPGPSISTSIDHPGEWLDGDGNWISPPGSYVPPRSTVTLAGELPQSDVTTQDSAPSRVVIFVVIAVAAFVLFGKG